MNKPGSVTRWICEMRGGSDRAAEALWDFYSRRLRGVLKKKLSSVPSTQLDDEDFAISTFYSFLRRARDGRLRPVDNRDDVWRHLVVIATRKALNYIRREKTHKRNTWRRAGAVTINHCEVADPRPQPDIAAMITDSLSSLLRELETEDLRRIASAKLAGYTNEEIALSLGTSVATVERRLKLIRFQWQHRFE